MTQAPLQGKKIIYTTTIGSSTWSFLEGQLAHFQHRGADVLAVSTPDRLFEEAVRREGVRSHGIHMERDISLRADIKALAKWISLLRKERPDILNAGTPKAALLGLISARLTRVPTRIYTVRGLRYETTTGISRVLLSRIEKLCCALATHVIAVGHGVAQQMRIDSITSSPVIVIGDGSSNGVQGDQIAKTADNLNKLDCRTESSIPTGSIVIGFVGRITPDKGGDCIAAAMQLLERKTPKLPFVLLIVGDAEDEDSALTLKTVPFPSVQTGWIDNPIPAYRAMDILCLPTKREGFPNVVLEAGAMGIPTVTTTATGAKESVIHGETGHVVPVDDPAKLAEALFQLGSSPQSRVAMGIAARQRVLSAYQPKRIWQTLEEVYKGTTPKDATYY